MINHDKNLREFYTFRFGSSAHPDVCWLLYRNAMKTVPTKRFSLIDSVLNDKDTRITKPQEWSSI